MSLNCAARSSLAMRAGYRPRRHRLHSSLTNCTASINRSRICCCRMWKRERCGSSSATTHNPGFYVNPPMLSPAISFASSRLSPGAVAGVLRLAPIGPRARAGCTRGLTTTMILAASQVLGDGDCAARAQRSRGARARPARRARSSRLGEWKSAPAERRIRYDADEDEHWRRLISSAFIKAAAAAIPTRPGCTGWPRRFVGGEDPRSIARRLVISLRAKTSAWPTRRRCR